MCIFDSLIDFVCTKEFLHDVVSSFVGLVVGILWGEFQFRRKEKERRKAVRQAFVDSFDNISKLVTQSIGQLEGIHKPNAVGIPNYTLDSISLVRLIDRADGAIPRELLQEIDGLRYQL